MAVRRTESRIPGGFTQQNADTLGPSTVSGNYALIAYFSDPVRRGADLQFRNRYVAFVNTAQVPQATADAIGYKWTVVFKSNSVQVFSYTGANSPVFNVDAAQIPNSGAINTAQTCEVTLEILNSGAQTPPKLILTHSTLANPRQEIETGSVNPLLNYTYFNNVKTTRKVANALDEYLRNSNQVFGKKLDVPVELPAAVLYGNVMPGFGEWKEDLIFEKLVNDPNAKPVFYAYAPTRIGVCGIKPHFLALALPKPTTATTPYLTTAQPATPTYYLTTPATKEADIYTAFANLSKDDQVDIYNLLRFPKSSVKMCAVLADHIRKAWYPAASAGELKKSKTYLKSVITQMEIGLQGATVFKVTTAAARIATMVNSNAIREILTTSAPLVDYKVIAIRVLDVRSGRPIANARVKRLVITSTLGMVSNTIGRNRVDTAGTVVDQNYLFAPTSVLSGVTDPAKKAQKALNELGFAVVPNTQNGSSFVSNAQAIAQYSNYWQSRLLNNSVPALTATSPLAAYEDYLDLIVEEYKAHSQTDENGVLKVRLPVNLLQNRGISIEVGFYEFPVATECIRSEVAAGTKLSRPLDAGQTIPKETETKFEVSWIGNQDLTWQSTAATTHFGWKFTKGATSANCKVNQVLTLSDTAAGNQIVLDPNQLSRFYHDTDYPYHFVLFGMVWCQPVWDDFADSLAPVDYATTTQTYVQDKRYRNMHMHLVTRPDDMPGSDKYGGKGYGKVEQRTNTRWRSVNTGTTDHAHLGMDIHARIGDKIFAVHYGTVTLANGGDGGKMVRLDWPVPAGKWGNITYLHLTEQLVSNGIKVFPGQILGSTGRSGNLGWTGANPSHVHLNVGAAPEEVIRLRNTPDEANKIVIPFNDIPLVFPCSCQVTGVLSLTAAQIIQKAATAAGQAELATTALIPCRFDDINYVKGCWAAAELKCPYINPTAKTNIQLQAQLRFLNERPSNGDRVDNLVENPNSPFFHPGGIDGNIGTAPAKITGALPINTPVEILADTQHNGRLLKIKFTSGSQTIKTWVEKSLVDLTSKKITQTLGGLIAETSVVSKVRMAVYVFRKQKGLLNFTDYSLNFSMDNAAWSSLNSETGLTP